MNKYYGCGVRLATYDDLKNYAVNHYEEMPTPGSDNVGEVIQYTGDTTEDFEKGHFYEVVEVEVSGITVYEYREIISSGQAVETMPEPSADLFGQVVQYSGANEGYLVPGHSYQCEQWEDQYGNVTYHWVDLDKRGTDVMPTANEENYGLILQYTGETSADYINGYFYECIYSGGEYVWERIDVQPSGGTPEGALLQVDTMPTAAADKEGDIVQYVGTPTVNYTPGYLYVCVSDGGDPATYTWESINTQDSPKTEETVRQANGWHLNDNNNTWRNNHAVYEDFQWILNECTAQDTYITPNFQVDGYHLAYFAQYTSSMANDYKRYRMLFTKLVDSTNYYYEVYFYAHYNNTTIYDETSNYKANKNGRYNVNFLTSHQSLSNYLAKNNTTSFTPTGDYNPATKKYVDDTATELEEAIEEASIQLDELPEPSSSNVGEVYQYTGPDTQDLDHGHFYEIVEKEVSGVVTYEYQDIGITVGVTTAVVPQEITDITYGAYRRYPGYSDTGLQLLQNNNGQLIWGQTVNSIWIGTQEEYDELPEHFDTMIYFIKEDE